MRLICPNCDAQYEVPDDVMPPEGRDVQCSNCGQTWFQEHPGTAAAKAPEDQTPAAEVAEPQEPRDNIAATAVEAPEAEDAAVVEADAAPEPAAETIEDAAPADIPPRRALDQAVVDVLREEAELEKQARQNEAARDMGQKPDRDIDETKGGDEARKRADATRDRVARMRSDRPDLPVAEAAAVASARRDQLPDIAEINSTLRSNSDRSPTEDPGQTAQIEAQERRGFGRGFVVTAFLVALLALAYAFAPQLAETLPQADPWLSAYVGIVDGWRVWLDGQIKDFLG